MSPNMMTKSLITEHKRHVDDKSTVARSPNGVPRSPHAKPDASPLKSKMDTKLLTSFTASNDQNLMTRSMITPSNNKSPIKAQT